MAHKAKVHQLATGGKMTVCSYRLGEQVGPDQYRYNEWVITVVKRTARGPKITCTKCNECLL